MSGNGIRGYRKGETLRSSWQFFCEIDDLLSDEFLDGGEMMQISDHIVMDGGLSPHEVFYSKNRHAKKRKDYEEFDYYDDED